jgi:hypothetical protein
MPMRLALVGPSTSWACVLYLTRRCSFTLSRGLDNSNASRLPLCMCLVMKTGMFCSCPGCSLGCRKKGCYVMLFQNLLPLAHDGDVYWVFMQWVLNECIDLPITSWTHVDFNVLSALLAVGGTRCIVNISKQLQLDPLWAVRLISFQQPPS